MNEQYQNTVVTIGVPNLGSDGTIAYLKFLGLCGAMAEVTDKKKDRGNRVVQFVWGCHQAHMAQTFLSKLNKVFNPSYLTIEFKQVNAFKDDWELFEYLLANHDWYYSFSDDPRVFDSGEANERRIINLRNELSKQDCKRANELWEKNSKH